MRSELNVSTVVCSQRPDVAELTRQREKKLERYRQQKETERKLSELHKAVTKEHVDEEVQVIILFLSRNCHFIQIVHITYSAFNQLNKSSSSHIQKFTYLLSKLFKSSSS